MEEKNNQDTVVHYKEPKKQEKKRPVHASPYAQEIERHMKGQFPSRQEKVFYEQESDLLQIEIHLLEAPEKQDFHVLYTVGMSALPMTLPPELGDFQHALERGELMLLLPGEWSLAVSETGEKENCLWWPVNLLRHLARFPHEYGTWLGFGHIIPNSENHVPYDESTALCGTMLGALQENISVLPLKEVGQLSIYTLIPLYKEEMDFKGKKGTEALLGKLAELKGFGMIIFPDRPNVAEIAE